MQASPEYLVSHGRSGEFSRFAAAAPLPCRRGDRVVVRSLRGLEVGVVLCEATARHARLLPHTSGELLRHAGAEDEQAEERLHALGQQLFEDGRRLAAELALALEVVDAEILLDGRLAVIHCLALASCDAGPLAEALSRQHNLRVHLENLALSAPEEEEEHGGCGEPGCGRSAGGGGCQSCGSGGGCSSCGGKVDLRDYFAHLRTRMEEKQQRTSLL